MSLENKRKGEGVPNTKTDSIKSLVEKGIPNLIFAKGNNPTSNHTSGHEAISQDNLHDGEFRVLNDYEDQWYAKSIYDETSSLLLFLKRVKYSVRYSSETEVQNVVGNLLMDMLVLCGLTDSLELKQETSLPKAIFLGRGTHKSDFYRVCVSSGRAVLVIEVKSPHNLDVLDHPKVKGQIADYMLDVMSFFGQEHVFGITTTMEEFRVHWFPHSNEYARATTLSGTVTGADNYIEGPMPLVERELVSSEVFHHTDELLIPTLVSVFHKSFHSPYRTVPMIDNHRMYVVFSDNGWRWNRLNLSPQQINALTFNLTSVAAVSTTYCVVKYFDRSSRVWLAIAHPSMQLIVIKFLDDSEQAQSEQKFWESINRCGGTYCTTIHGTSALCMPLAIHAQEKEGRVNINFDLSAWSSQLGALTELPPHLVTLSRELQTMGRDINLVEVARKAVQKCAEQKIIHTDLAWRHIAVLPIFGQDGSTLVSLEPVLIDFDNVEEACSVERASDVMNKRLDEMIANCDFDF